MNRDLTPPPVAPPASSEWTYLVILKRSYNAI